MSEFCERQLTFNREDWSGNMITVLVDNDNGFEFDGYRFKLVEHINDGDYRSFNLISKDWDYPLFAVGKFADDKVWEVCHMDLTRSGRDPVIAAIRMLCMTL